jgi:hypothetical protein
MTQNVLSGLHTICTRHAYTSEVHVLTETPKCCVLQTSHHTAQQTLYGIPQHHTVPKHCRTTRHPSVCQEQCSVHNRSSFPHFTLDSTRLLTQYRLQPTFSWRLCKKYQQLVVQSLQKSKPKHVTFWAPNLCVRHSMCRQQVLC